MKVMLILFARPSSRLGLRFRIGAPSYRPMGPRLMSADDMPVESVCAVAMVAQLRPVTSVAPDDCHPRLICSVFFSQLPLLFASRPVALRARCYV